MVALDQCFSVCRLRDRGCMSKSGYTLKASSTVTNYTHEQYSPTLLTPVTIITMIISVT